MSAFLHMGGYAAYVWPAYGLSMAGLVAIVLLSLNARRALRRQIARLESPDGEPTK